MEKVIIKNNYIAYGNLHSEEGRLRTVAAVRASRVEIERISSPPNTRSKINELNN